MRALNRKLLRDLWHLRGQVIAVAAVVMCGIAAFVTMRSAYTALVDAQASYYRRYRFADVFAHATRAPEAVAARIRELPGVATVQTRIVAEVVLDVPGLPEPATGRLVSIPERRAPILNDLHLRSGRWVEPDAPGEVIVSEGFAGANGLEIGSRIGAVINGRWQRLTVVGVGLSPEYVYEIRGIEVFPDNRRFGVLWMGREALGASFDLQGAFNDVSVALAPGAPEAPVIDGIDRLLERSGGLGAYGRDLQLSNRFLSDEIKQDRVSGLYLPSIFLGVAVFLVHVVLSRLVGSQRDQIAILKAFGYTNTAVGLHYLGVALAAVLAGAVPGTLLGLWFASYLADLYAKFFHFPEILFSVSPGLISFAAAISAAAALFGATSAVRHAVRMPPAEAMRPESPPRYSRGILERLGLARLLPPPVLMIARNLGRRPAKALLSTFGIALAVGILVLTRYFGDVVDWMVRIQFRETQREDVTVILGQPRSAAVLHELAHLPGVRAVEPFRVVSVRLVSGHRSRRIEIMGVEPAGELRRLVTRTLGRVEVPPEGLVLTAALARILEIAPGDPVTVEVLEGRRLVRRDARRRDGGGHPRPERDDGHPRPQPAARRGGDGLRGLSRGRRDDAAAADRAAQAHPGRRRGLRAREHAREFLPDHRPVDDGDQLRADPLRLHHRLRDRLQRGAHLALRARARAGLAAGARLHPARDRGDPARRARPADAGRGPARVRDRGWFGLAAGLPRWLPISTGCRWSSPARPLRSPSS